MSQLDAWRAQLDVLDTELINTLAARAKLVNEIWAWKQANGVALFDAEREAAVRARLVERGVALGLSADALENVLSTIVGKALSSGR